MVLMLDVKMHTRDTCALCRQTQHSTGAKHPSGQQRPLLTWYDLHSVSVCLPRSHPNRWAACRARTPCSQSLM